MLQDFLGAENAVIDATFFNHTLNDSFTNLKISELLKEAFIVSNACITGIEEPIPPLEGYQWQVFPNPFPSEIQLSSLEDHNHVTIRVYSMTGSLVHQETATPENNRIKLALGHLNQGTYMLQIVTELNTETHKIIKR